MSRNSVDPANPNMSKAYNTNHGVDRDRFKAIYDTNVKAEKGGDLRQKRPNAISFDDVFKGGGKNG
jgi:hypothetical protein